MSEIKGDNQIALEFLLRWAPDSPWLLSAVDPERKKGMITSSFDKVSQQKALAFINHWNGKRNLYFHVNVPRTILADKAKKHEIGWMTAVHVDVDPGAPPKDADAEAVRVHYETEYAKIQERINSYKPEPSVIIFSGGGFQAFWLLAEPIEIDEPSEAKPEPWTELEAYNRRPEKDLGGDHCFNIDRIMRLPGTVNLPDAKKRAKGRVPSIARVISAEWDKLYKLDVFEPWIEEKKEKPKRGRRKKKGSDENWVDRVLANGPDHEGPRSFNGDRSTAMWAVICALVRRGWEDPEILAAITDKNNKLSEHVYAQDRPEKYAQRQVERAREKVGEDFARDDKDKIIVNQANIRLGLSMIGVKLSYNMFNRKDMIEGPDAMPLRIVQDEDIVKAWLTMEEECYFRPSKQYFQDVLLNECKENSFHPVRDYLNKQKWDGKSRIDTWLIDYAGAEDTPYIRAVGAIILMAAVRRVRQPGVKFDEMMVFESPQQGLDKSSALSILAVNPEWFSDSLPLDADDKKVIEILDGKWIVEAPELKGIKGKSMEHLKAFLSRQIDRARMAFGKITSEVPRQCVIFATTNSTAYLSDPTGNRRFWPVRITKWDMIRLRADVHELWAEAAMREATDGTSIRLDPSLYANASKEQEERYIEDPWKNLIEAALANTPTGRILGQDLWHIVNVPVGLRTQYHNVRLNDVMKELEWDRNIYTFNKKPARGFAKGDAFERQTRILIDRTDMALEVRYEDESVVKNNDREIPF